MRRGVVVLLAVLAACTSAPPEAGPPPDGLVPPPEEARDLLVLGVVASLSGPTSAVDRTFVDGMRVAERQVNADGGIGGQELRLSIVDDEGRDARSAGIAGRLLRSGRIAALLVVGPGSAVSTHRAVIEEVRVPVFLLGGDLYSTRQLFRWAFQTSVPYRWQARVLGRYLARDRRAGSVVLVTEAGHDSARARDVALRELAAEGAPADRDLVVGPGESPRAAARMAVGADAVVALTSAEVVVRLAEELGRVANPPQVAAATAALASEASLPPGTVAPYGYAWAGWADPIPRVGRFRGRVERALDHRPGGFEQEGYDAVRVLADALEETEAASGQRLLTALESLRPEGEVFSSLPVVLGPDDHTTTDETYVGLFAVAGPDEQLEPWVPEDRPWRPIIRTFTSDGERTIFHERDRKVFFPFWKQGRPSPKFFRSRYGITTRPAGDPLH